MPEAISVVVNFVRQEIGTLFSDAAVWHGCGIGIVLTLTAALLLWILLQLARLPGKRKCGSVTFDGEHGTCTVTAAAVSDAIEDSLASCAGLEFMACRIYRKHGVPFVLIDCRWAAQGASLAEAVQGAREKILDLLHGKLGLAQLEKVDFKIKSVAIGREE